MVVVDVGQYLGTYSNYNVGLEFSHRAIVGEFFVLLSPSCARYSVYITRCIRIGSACRGSLVHAPCDIDKHNI
jgi:hypothetical protein